MNALFGTLTTDGLEEAQDRLGGFRAFETDAYDGVIKMAYAGQAKSGARSITLVVDMEGSQEYRETIYITNKKGENFFLNKSDQSKKVPLPGFTTINDICLVTDGKSLAEQATEDKMVNVYDPEAKKEIPTSVPVLVDLLGKKVTLGIVKTLENKSVKDSNNQYQPTPETREVNHIDKVFHTETKMTVVEATNEAEEATFYGAWVERNKGQTRDKREIKDGQGGQAGKPGAAPQPSGSSGRKSLFGK